MAEKATTFNALKIFFYALCLVCLSIIFILTDLQSDGKGIGQTLPYGVAVVQNSVSISMPASVSDVAAELKRRTENASEKKLVIFWHVPGWFSRRQTINRKVCGNCEATFDKNMINDSRTAAVVIHYAFVKAGNMPNVNTRTPNQLHILWQTEPPTHFFPRLYVLNTTYKFNATVSYRRASDFYLNLNLGYLRRTKNRNVSKPIIMKMKNKLAISMVSNCGSNPGAETRMKILRRLQNLGLAIDGYGGCFKNNSIKKGSNVAKFINSYKFFMSFENSYHCQDYMTEKVYRNGFQSLAVPVVWGATKEDYATFLPEGSYIFAEDFETLESLVDFLKYLDNNDTAYLSYFDWYQRKLPPEGGGRTDASGWLCQICRALHGINYDDRHRPDYDPVNPRIPTFTNGIAKRHISSVRSYIFGEENPECIASSAENWDFYKRWKL